MASSEATPLKIHQAVSGLTSFKPITRCAPMLPGEDTAEPAAFGLLPGFELLAEDILARSTRSATEELRLRNPALAEVRCRPPWDHAPGMFIVDRLGLLLLLLFCLTKGPGCSISLSSVVRPKPILEGDGRGLEWRPPAAARSGSMVSTSRW